MLQQIHIVLHAFFFVFLREQQGYEKQGKVKEIFFPRSITRSTRNISETRESNRTSWQMTHNTLFMCCLLWKQQNDRYSSGDEESKSIWDKTWNITAVNLFLWHDSRPDIFQLQYLKHDSFTRLSSLLLLMRFFSFLYLCFCFLWSIAGRMASSRK